MGLAMKVYIPMIYTGRLMPNNESAHFCARYGPIMAFKPEELAKKRLETRRYWLLAERTKEKWKDKS